MSLRVLFTLPCRFWGGPERQTLQSALTLRQAGAVEPSFAVLVRPGEGEANPLLARARAEGIPAVPFALSRRYDLREAVAGLRALVQAQRPHLLVTAGYKANVISALARPVPAIARVTGWTGEDWKVRAFEWLDRRLLHRHDAVVVVSQAQRRRVEDCHVRPARLVTVPNAVDLGKLAPPADRQGLRRELGLPADAVLVGAVGRLSPEKGQEVLIEAMARSSARHAHLVLVGDGPSESQLRRRVAALGLEDRTHWLGLRRDGAQLIGALDLLVLPSFTEGLPNVVLEAFAYRTPLVACAVGGVPELVGGPEHGRLVPPGEPAALAREIDAALADPAGGATRAERAHRRVQAHFSAAVQAEAWQTAFQVALASRS